MTTKPLRQLKILTLWHSGFAALLTGGCAWAFGPAVAGSFAVGAGLALANVLALAWAWWRLLTEKPVAWTVVLIVIKYAVLLSSIYFLARTGWFEVIPAGLGIASFIPPVFVLAVFYQERESTGG